MAHKICCFDILKFDYKVRTGTPTQYINWTVLEFYVRMSTIIDKMNPIPQSATQETCSSEFLQITV